MGDPKKTVEGLSVDVLDRLDPLKNDYLDQTELAHVIGCHRTFIIELTKAGKLPHLFLSERRKLYSAKEVRKALIYHFGVGYDYKDEEGEHAA